MLTAEDREEIKRIVWAMIAESGPSFSGEHEGAGDWVHDVFAKQGFTEVMIRNPMTGEEKVLEAWLESDPIVDVLARAIEVFGTREKALRWLRTPVRSLGNKTPISLLNSPEGLARLQDTLGQVEHGVW